MDMNVVGEAIDYTALIQPDRVHSRVYSDQTIFDEEMEKIFSKTWVFVGHDGEIPNSGDFRQRKIGWTPVIMVRDDEGQVHVMYNRCTHRGSALCNTEGGTTRAFTCAYHGWRFRLDGRLAVVPYSDRYPADFSKEDHNLTHVPRVESRFGFRFACLNAGVGPLDDHLGPLVLRELADVAALSPEGELIVTAGVHRTRYSGNWKFQNENAIDGYHPNFSHRSYFDMIEQRTGYDPKVLATSSAPQRVRHLGNGHCTWDSSSFQQVTRRPSTGPYADAMFERHGKERAEALMRKAGSHLYIFPNFIYVGSHFRIVTPIRVDETEVQLFPILLKGAPPEVNRSRLRQHESFYGPAGGGNTDDLEVFIRGQAGVQAEGNPWVLISRGIHLEEKLNDGSVSAQITDELTNRAIWQRWKDLMTGTEKNRAFA
jgi:phenylpropionate dioxygenase-like ring-hydroxylating dioxygenase large terminal subunit